MSTAVKNERQDGKDTSPQLQMPEKTNRRTRSPGQQPQTDVEGEQIYVLTLQTDKKLHTTMTALRERHFPPHLNHLEAHLTLFHALPESKLETDFLPMLENLAQRTEVFELAATTPFKLRRGIAIGMPKDHGGNKARALHRSMVSQWKSYLSQQDMSFAPHFTIMNKVDQAKDVEDALDEIQHNFRPCFGIATGLSLYKYHPRGWEPVRTFDFQRVRDE